MFMQHRAFTWGVLTALAVVNVSMVRAQVVINELVQDNRTNGFGNSVDTGEFIELYNSSGALVDLAGWTLNIVDLDGVDATIVVPLFGSIAANDPYYVIGNSAGLPVGVVDFDIGASDQFPNDNNLYELRNPLGELIDALGVQLTFDPQYQFVTTEQLAQIGGGGWSQIFTTVETPQSYARFRDGEDTNKNGRDFGVIPSTPGASNNLPEIGAFVLPDVDALGLPLGSNVPGFSYSFVGPKVVDPTQLSAHIKHTVPASPQGGNAIVAWDETGGGNMVASNSLVTSFDIWAYFDTGNNGATGTAKQIEATTYGIGTTDGLFGTPDPTGQLTTFQETSNGNTGVGWVFIKEDTLNFKKLFLVDFNDGGDSKPLDPENPTPTAGDWTVLETIDLVGIASDWFRLSIDYDADTGALMARFGNQVFNHTITTDMVGTFYVGFREPAASGVLNSVAPPIFDFYEPSAATGDFNGDGVVDGRDLLAWQRGESPNSLSASDLALWQSQYGNGALAAVSAVPEPAVGMLLVALCGLLSATRIREASRPWE
jgi:hypothetical protein